MRKHLLFSAVVLGAALLLPMTAPGGDAGRQDISAQDFGLPPVSPAQFGPDTPMPGQTAPHTLAPAPAPQPVMVQPPVMYQAAPAPRSPMVYTAQNTAPEGTASFLEPHVAAMTLQNPLPPAPPAVSSGSFPVDQARPLAPPSAPYPVPSQATYPAITQPVQPVVQQPAPRVAAPAGGMAIPVTIQVPVQPGQSLEPIMLPPITATVSVMPGGGYQVTDAETGAVMVQAPGPGEDPNVVSFVVPIQIPASGDARWGQVGAADQAEIIRQAQMAAAEYMARQGMGQPQQQSFAVVSRPSGEYIDLDSVPAGSVILVTPAQVKEAVMRGARMIIMDVRAELVRDVEGHINGDIHMEYLPRETFVQRVMARIPDRSMPLVLYCHDGIWSSQAAAELAQAGYRVFTVGGFRLWL